MTKADLFDFLEAKTREYNRPAFIESDPVSIPHLFTRKEDIEISAFLAATIAWGQRPVIIRNAQSLMQRMDDSPYEFVLNASPRELKNLDTFVHRTFNGTDLRFFIRSLRNMYMKHGGMEKVFTDGMKLRASLPAEARPAQRQAGVSPWLNPYHAIVHFRHIFFSVKHESRSEKHVSNPAANSSAKRINMFLRWMVRQDNAGVDFGIWKNISPSLLCCPLDVHVGNVARRLGLLERTQDDWKAVEELTAKLREFDANDPVKYDFALFGLGIFENFAAK